MRFLLLSSGGQASCLKTLMKELVAREHEYFLADSNFLKNEFTTLENLHSQSFDAVIMTDYKFKKYASCKGKKKPVISTIHHGIGLKIKDSFLDDYFVKCPVDIVFTSGHLYYQTLNKYSARIKDVYVTGFPKTDELVKYKSQCKTIKQSLIEQYNFNEEKSVVLYAPTWSRHKYSYGTIQSFDKIYKELNNEFNIILAPHPSDMRWLNKTFNFKKYSDVKIFTDVNKCRVILGSDIILSDNSSIAMESALIEKPIVHVVNSYAKETMHLYLDETKPRVKLGEIIKLPEDTEKLKESIYKALSNIDYNFTKAYWVSMFTSGCNGNSTNRVIDILEMYVNKFGGKL